MKGTTIRMEETTNVDGDVIVAAIDEHGGGAPGTGNTGGSATQPGTFGNRTKRNPSSPFGDTGNGNGIGFHIGGSRGESEGVRGTVSDVTRGSEGGNRGDAGDGIGSGDGSGSPIPKRRGRKPKQQSAELVEPDVRGLEPEPNTPLPKKGRGKKNDISEDVVTCMVQMGLEVPAYVTGHDWWRQSEEKVQPIVCPLQRIINNASPEVKKVIQRYADPIALVVGCVTVIGPCIEMEIEYKKAKREAYLEKARSAGNQAANINTNRGNVAGSQTEPAAANTANVSADPIFSNRIPELYPS